MNDDRRIEMKVISSPPKNYNRIDQCLFDPIWKSDSSTHWPLQRKPPNQCKIKEDNIFLGNSLEEYINKYPYVFKSSLPNTIPIQFWNKNEQSQQLVTSNQSENLHRKSYTKKPIKKTNTYQLQFNDSFQSSNLALAAYYNEQTYLLTLRSDYNTYNYGNQWFYFRVKNNSEYDQQFRMIILNMSENGYFLGEGKRISVWRCGLWGKEGKDILFGTTPFIKKSQGHQNNRFYCWVGFSVFLHAHQEIYIARNQPYTYTKLYRYMDNLINDENAQKSIKVKRDILCRTFLGNRIEIITISNTTNNNQLKRSSNKNKPTINNKVPIKNIRYTQQPKLIKEKQIIVIIARVNIESSSSYAIESLIDQLTHQPQPLLQHYNIVIVPMANPDGVILGNSLTNAKGYHLQYYWNTNTTTIPEIYHLKKYLSKNKSKIAMVVNLYGSSSQKNVFIHSNQLKNNKNNEARQFSYILSKICENKSIFQKSRWKQIDKYDNKHQTIGDYLTYLLNINLIITLHISQFTADNNQYHYDQTFYRELGSKLLSAINMYFSPEQQIINQKLSIMEEMKLTPSNYLIGSYEDNQQLLKPTLIMKQYIQIEQLQPKLKSKSGSKTQLPRKLTYRRHIKTTSEQKNSKSKSKSRVNIQYDDDDQETYNPKTDKKKQKRKTQQREETLLTSNKKSKQSLNRNSNTKKISNSNHQTPNKIQKNYTINYDRSTNKIMPQQSKKYQQSLQIKQMTKLEKNQKNVQKLPSIIQASCQMNKSDKFHLNYPQLKSKKVSYQQPQMSQISQLNGQKNRQVFSKAGKNIISKNQFDSYQLIKIQSKVHPKLNQIIPKGIKYKAHDK